MTTVKSDRSNVEMGSVMKMPSMMRTGVVAILGITRKAGEKTRANRNRGPVLQTVSPTQPPAAIPVALWVPQMVTVLMPRMAPTAAALAEAKRDLLFSITGPALGAIPWNRAQPVEQVNLYAVLHGVHNVLLKP